jgi:hypothetical protein
VRRRAGEDVPPPGLLVFDGREFGTAAEWTEAYDAWYDAREDWEAAHLGVVLPEKRVLSSCPFDGMSMIGLPHAGGWSRRKGPDGEDETRCGAHDLTPDQH